MMQPKYLFKYINKGYDRITIAIVPAENVDDFEMQSRDEVKQYMDCRYISPCDAYWRIFVFPIQGRTPKIKRLYFHLLEE